MYYYVFFFFKQKTAYEMRISDWSSDVCSSDLAILQSLSHGFMTALFFALIGMIYERTHTRDIMKLGGLLKVIPFISAIYIIAGKIGRASCRERVCQYV